jgi:hypothetical protein
MPFAASNSRKKTRWGRGSESSSTGERYDVGRVNRQIDNAETRIRDAGYTPEDSDKRNWFEKATNLPQGQNALFDVLELLSRPGQAVINAIDKAPRGDRGVGEAMWRGFSGKDRVRGAELFKDIDSKPARFVLGTAAEIALDPVSYIPGGAIVKGVTPVIRGTGTVARRALDAAEKASPGLKRFRENTLQPAAEAVKDTLGYGLVPDYKLGEDLFGRTDDTVKRLKQETENRIGFQTDEAMKGVAEATKAAGGIDKGTLVGRIMEKDLRQFEDVKGYEFPDGATRTTDKGDLFKAIEDNRIRIKELGQNVRATGREYDKAISETASLLERTDKQIRRMYYSRENEALRNLNKLKNKPLNIDELAQSKAFGQVSISPAFNYLLQRRDELKQVLDTLRQEAKQAKYSAVADITKLTDENEALRESARNPVMIQQEIQRPVRDMPNDPAITQAAQRLMQSNNELRQWAQDNGIEVGELEGYMKHVLSKAERAERAKVMAMPIDRGNNGTGQPNKKVVAGREITGSVEDINERVGREMFEPNAFFATAIGQKQLIDYANSAKFRGQVLSNPNFAQKYEKGMDVPKNAVIIDTNEYKFINNDANELAEEVGGQYVVTKAVKQALDRYKKLTSDEGINGFIKAFDTVQSFWKRGALFSVPYHLRNVAGAMFNNYVGGMNAASLIKYTGEAYPEVYNAYVKGQESPLFREFREQGLGSSGQLQIEFARRGEEPEDAIRRTIEKRSKQDGTLATRMKTELADLKNPLNAFETSRQFGDFNDQAMRFALFKWYVDKQKGKMSDEELYRKAADKVREVQFDYSRTTPFEREVMTRVAPFYRWVRNNLPFQLRSFINDPRKYANVNKIRLNAQESAGIDDENVPDFFKENFAIPVTGAEDGSGHFLGLNLPLGDLTKLSDPLKLAVDQVSSLIKLPAEVSMNRSFFFDRPLSKFEGHEKKFAIPEEVYGINVPGGGTELGGIDQKLAYVLESLGGQPVRGLSNLLTPPKEEDQSKKFLAPGLGISSMFKPYDVKSSEYFEQYEQLQKLLDLIKYIEQQTGQEVRTLNQINGGR